MKILVVMKNWLGDLLFQMPAIDLIKAKHPGTSIVCVAPERCREILEAHPAVSGFMSFDEKSTHRSWLKRIAFIFKLRKAGPWDEGYLFHRSRSRAVMLWLAGVKKRIGYGKGRKMFLTAAVKEPASKLHQLDHFMDLMKGAGYEIPQNPSYRFYFKPEDEMKALAVLSENGISISLSHCEEPRRGDVAISLQKNEIASLAPCPASGGTRGRNDAKASKYICFHLGANWGPKRWPAGHFAELAEKVHEKWGIPVVVTGSAQDRPLFDAFKKGVSHHFPKMVTDPFIVDLVGKTPIRVSSVIYKNAACLVTGDSGPMHIAAGVGARVVAIFGPTDPDLTGPRGSGDAIVLQYVPPGFSIPFFGKDLPEDGWLSKISPDEVLEAIERIFPR